MNDSGPAPQPLPQGISIALSPLEELFWRSEQDIVGAASARLAILVWLDGWIEADVLATALRRLQQRHPKLRARITPKSEGWPHYRFDEAAPPIPCAITDHDEAEPPWREETRRLLQMDTRPEGPHAAVSVFRHRSGRRCQLILTVHHAIADGRSGISLIDDLLAEYANIEADPLVAPGPVLPLISAARATPSGGWTSRMWLLRRFIRLQREERRCRQTSLPAASEIPTLAQWVHWTFTPTETLQLVRRCRKEQASFGGAIVAAVCCGLMDSLPETQGVFKCQVPFDLRHELQGPVGPVRPGDLGCFMSTMNEFYQVPRHPAFWDLARRAHQDVKTFVERGGPSFYYNVLAAPMAGRLFTRHTAAARTSGGKRPTLFATNYGVISIRELYGSLRPRGCTLMFNSDEMSPSLVMEALVMQQQLNIGFAANQLDPEFWARLLIAVRRHLDTATDSGSSANASL
jgi:Condensation domain